MKRKLSPKASVAMVAALNLLIFFGAVGCHLLARLFFPESISPTLTCLAENIYGVVMLVFAFPIGLLAFALIFAPGHEHALAKGAFVMCALVVNACLWGWCWQRLTRGRAPSSREHLEVDNKEEKTHNKKMHDIFAEREKS